MPGLHRLCGGARPIIKPQVSAERRHRSALGGNELRAAPGPARHPVAVQILASTAGDQRE